ncbi:putative Zn(II)2Cys6 transcription factor [Aspergillus tubingensis]|uniref:putative Zn(II)2Cys6 transcription factor n=1 Tax=Aspergillus tubingensis TaxID=5068 RepID=UPI0015795A28|nr:putative Zn(II)2Cys6 transcription factor [Aspergillus tubingensis]GFN20297.1 putative Zn(II)2Cys6 transcription factor [Aspergillus tubingensis]
MQQDTTNPPKRKRLSFACNYCRSRKTRCDERQPACTACLLAGMECITTDKRRPGVRVYSRRRNLDAASTSENIPFQDTVQNPVASPLLGSVMGLAIPELLPMHSPGSTSPESITRLHDDTFRIRGAHPQHSSRESSCTDCPPAPATAPSRPRERYTGRLPMMPRFCGTSTVQLMTNWLDLAFRRLGIPDALSSAGLFGPSFRSSTSLPPSNLYPTGLPDPPTHLEASRHLSRYLSDVHPIFPIPIQGVLERVHSTIFTAADSPKALLAQQDPPLQALYCVALILGAGAARPTSTGFKAGAWMAYCNSLLGHLIGYRTIRSIQAIFLLSLALLEFDRVSDSHDVVKLAIGMGQSIGLGGGQRPRGSSTHPDEGIETWWCSVVFEKLLAFITCQPSSVGGIDPGLDPSDWADDGSSTDLHFYALRGLGRTLHEINDQAIRVWEMEESQDLSPEDSIREKLGVAGKLVMLLDEWHEKLIKLQLLLTPATSTNVRRKVFFTSQYYNTLILLHRATLLVDRDDLLRALRKYGAQQPWQDLASSAAVSCTEAARSMITLVVHLEEINASTVPFLINPTLAASYALCVRILIDPVRKMNRSDYELMKVGLQFARDRHRMYNPTDTLDLGQNLLRNAPVEQLSSPSSWGVSADEGRLQLVTGTALPSIDWTGWSLDEVDDISFSAGR